MKGEHTGTTTLRFRELPNDSKPSTLIIVDVDLRKVEVIEGGKDRNIITGTLFLALAGKKPERVSKKPMARGDENDWRFGHITFDLNDCMPFLSNVKGIWKFRVEARRYSLGTEMSQLLPSPLKYEIGIDDVRRKQLGGLFEFLFPHSYILQEAHCIYIIFG